jgi:hypothetical protein
LLSLQKPKNPPGTNSNLRYTESAEKCTLIFLAHNKAWSSLARCTNVGFP